MFGNIEKNQKNQQSAPKDGNVLKEAQLDQKNSIQPMGNEAANVEFYTNMLREANADNMLDLAEYIDPKDVNIDNIKDKPNPLALPGADDPNNSMYLDSSHNIVNDNNFINGVNVKDLQSSAVKKKDEEDKKDLAGSGENLLEIDTRPHEIIEKEKQAKLAAKGGKAPVQNIIAPFIQAAVQQAANAPAQQEEARPEFYVDPEDAYKELEDPEHPLNRDMVVEAPKKRGKGKKKSSKSKKSGNNINIINQDMQGAAGWDFNAQKLPARKEASWLRRFLTGTSYYAGRSIGKLFNIIGNMIYVPLTWSFSKLWRSRSNRKDNPLVTQETRDHETIPGWNGDKFDKSGDRTNDVIADFRKVPTVWSRLTAEEAVDSKGNVLPPKVGIYVDKPVEKEDKDVNWMNFGHSGIGIEYSRYSRQTQRYERYALRYGFCQNGPTISGGIMANSGNVLVPGRLADEYGDSYTVSRKFKATSKQVNDILRASQPWADKGYNASKRNCTTFVKEMVRDVAHLPLANDIFTEDNLRLTGLGNFIYFGSSASKTNARMGMESQFDKLGQMDDMSYAGFGNKRYTKQDYRQYKDTLGEGLNRVTTADTPNSAAENMRRLEGKYAGEIGSFGYYGSIPKDEEGNLLRSYDAIKDAINEDGEKIAALILQLTGKSKEEINSLWRPAQDIVEVFTMFDQHGAGETLLEAKNADGDPESLRVSRLQVDQLISKLNKLLFVYFKNDKRLHIPVMHMISLLNNGIAMIDNDYRDAIDRQESGEELGNIRGQMGSAAYQINAGDYETMMTPSHYESYIQIYGSAEEAVKQYAAYRDLKQRDDDPNQTLTKEEKKNYKKLQRIDKLADHFDQSHRYMLEKDSYKQQDVDYAFSLSKKEAGGGEAYGALLNKNLTSSAIYQALIFVIFFGGMKQRYLNQFKTKEQGFDLAAIHTWLENDMLTCVNRKKDEFTTVIRAIYRNLDEKDDAHLFYDLRQALSYNWLEKIFKQGDKNGPLSNGPNVITEALAEILGDDQSRFITRVKTIAKFVSAEDKIAKPDSLQKIRKNKQ